MNTGRKEYLARNDAMYPLRGHDRLEVPQEYESYVLFD